MSKKKNKPVPIKIQHKIVQLYYSLNVTLPFEVIEARIGDIYLEILGLEKFEIAHELHELIRSFPATENKEMDRVKQNIIKRTHNLIAEFLY